MNKTLQQFQHRLALYILWSNIKEALDELVTLQVIPHLPDKVYFESEPNSDDQGGTDWWLYTVELTMFNGDVLLTSFPEIPKFYNWDEFFYSYGVRIDDVEYVWYLDSEPVFSKQEIVAIKKLLKEIQPKKKE